MALGRIGTVRIIHPGYSRLILPLPAFPHLSASEATTPLAPAPDHSLVLAACRVVTNHAAKEGHDYLSKYRGGNDRVLAPSAANTLQLPPGEHFYHPGPPSATTTPNYPIVTDFAAWNFPERIPAHWIRPMASAQMIAEFRRKYMWCKPRDRARAVKSGETGCIVTGTHLHLCEAVHIVPRAHWQWFYRNDMTRYNWAGGRTGVSDPANGLALRLDVGRIWGLNCLLVFPAGEGKYMTYLTVPHLGLADDFHLRWVSISRRVSDAFLYARFAYNIITLVAKWGDSELNAFPLSEGVEPSRRGVPSTPKYAQLFRR